MSKKVSFTSMDQGTQADYDLVNEYHHMDGKKLAARALDWMRMMDDADSPYQISRLEHCLQTATRAEDDGADGETIACALLHDIGDVIAPANHSQVAAAMLAPYVSEKNHWIIRHHGLFQGYYYFHYMGQDRHARERHKDHPYYQACVDFCANWDQTSFDPSYDTRPLEYFEPLVVELFSREPAPFV
ncbi:MAG: HD domain-containing protein [Pseudomonadota bacterium]